MKAMIYNNTYKNAVELMDRNEQSTMKVSLNTEKSKKRDESVVVESEKGMIQTPRPNDVSQHSTLH